MNLSESNVAKTISVLALLSLCLFACGDDLDSEYETSESSLTFSASSDRASGFTARSTTDRTGSRDLTADPDATGVYTCCDRSNNCYDIELDENCAAGETLLWCMGDGLCEPGKNTD